MSAAHNSAAGPVSLLFTPPGVRGGDGSRTPETRGALRSPRAQPSLLGPGTARGVRWDSTPSHTRRRSLTPGSTGLAREPPPPPPTTSLMDAGASPGAVPMDISPARDVGSEAVLQHPPRQQPYEGCWVTGAAGGSSPGRKGGEGRAASCGGGGRRVLGALQSCVNAGIGLSRHAPLPPPFPPK